MCPAEAVGHAHPQLSRRVSLVHPTAGAMYRASIAAASCRPSRSARPRPRSWVGCRHVRGSLVRAAQVGLMAGGASLVEISFPHCCGDVYQTLKCDGRGSLSSRGCAVTDARIFTVVKENANIASYHPLISPQHTKPTCIGDACAMHARPACPSHLMSRRVREIRSHQGLGNDERFHPQDATPRPLHPIRLPLALRLSS